MRIIFENSIKDSYFLLPGIIYLEKHNYVKKKKKMVGTQYFYRILIVKINIISE